MVEVGLEAGIRMYDPRDRERPRYRTRIDRLIARRIAPCGAGGGDGDSPAKGSNTTGLLDLRIYRDGREGSATARVVRLSGPELRFGVHVSAVRGVLFATLGSASRPRSRVRVDDPRRGELVGGGGVLVETVRP